MEYFELLKHRTSSRKFTQEQITDEQLQAIIDAAQMAPVGSSLMWYALDSMKRFPELDNTHLLGIPEDFETLMGLAVGNIEKALPIREINMNRIVKNIVNKQE